MTFLGFFVYIPLCAAFILAFLGKRIKGLNEWVSILVTLTLMVLSGVLVRAALINRVLVYSIGDPTPHFNVTLVADSLSAFMLVTVSLIAFLVNIYSLDYVKRYTQAESYYALFMLMLSGMSGVILSGDIFSLYVFMEVAAIAGYSLVAFGTEANELEASFKYAVMGAIGSIFILLGIAFLYGYASTFNMADISKILAEKGPAAVLSFVGVLFIMGFGLKSAVIPFHAWLADAHSSAPTPISAMLSGVVIKVLGIYSLCRIFLNVFGASGQLSAAFIILGILSMVVASLLAVGQTDLKRLLAYSSVSQIGYIVLGLGTANPIAITGALFHLFNHSLFKSLLFLNSGAIETLTGSRDIRQIKGVMKKSPVVGYTNLIGALSISGMPPFGGFWSKLLIILGCIQSGHFAAGAIAIGAGILTLVYYFKALTPVLFGADSSGDTRGGVRLSPAICVPLVILAVFCVFSGLMLLPNFGNQLLKNAASLLSESGEYLQLVSGVIRQ